MTKREVRLRLFFETAVYVSSKEGPDILKITFRDPYLFIGVNDLTINGPSESARVLSEEVASESKFLTLKKAIPP